MSNFVDPRRPNNVPGNFCFLLVFLSAEGFEDSETAMMEFLTTYEARIADARHPMKTALLWIAAATSQYSEVYLPS